MTDLPDFDDPKRGRVHLGLCYADGITRRVATLDDLHACLDAMTPEQQASFWTLSAWMGTTIASMSTTVRTGALGRTMTVGRCVIADVIKDGNL